MDPMSLYNIESIHHGHRSPLYTNQKPDSPFTNPETPCQKESSDQAMICGISVNWRTKEKNMDTQWKNVMYLQKSHETSNKWGCLGNLGRHGFFCCNMFLHMLRITSATRSTGIFASFFGHLVCDRTDRKRKCRDGVIPFVQDGGPYY